MLSFEGTTYYKLKRYDDAIASFKSATEIGPKSVTPRGLLALTLAEVGRVEEARAEARALLEFAPQFKSASWLRSRGLGDPADFEKRLALMREIGLP